MVTGDTVAVRRGGGGPGVNYGSELGAKQIAICINTKNFAW